MWAWVMGEEGGNVQPHRLLPQGYPCHGAPLTSPLGCLFLFDRNLFLGLKNSLKKGFLRILFFLCFPEEFFTGTWFWKGSQEFLFFATFTGFFCWNSCETGIPAFTMDSSRFLQIPLDSSGFLFPPNAVLLWPATKVGFLLSKY
jgi:hypothetical protein